jgi:hypothetical protein
VYCKIVKPSEVLRDSPYMLSDAWTKKIFPEVYAWTRYPVFVSRPLPGENQSATPPAAAGVAEGQPIKRMKVPNDKQVVGLPADIEACSRGNVPVSYRNPYITVKSQELLESQDAKIAVRLFDDAYTAVTPVEALTKHPSHIPNAKAVHEVLATMKREKLTTTKRFRIKSISLVIASQRAEMSNMLKYNNPHKCIMWKMKPDSEVARSIARARERQDAKDLKERRGGDGISEVAPISEFYTRA